MIKVVGGTDRASHFQEPRQDGGVGSTVCSLEGTRVLSRQNERGGLGNKESNVCLLVPYTLSGYFKVDVYPE